MNLKKLGLELPVISLSTITVFWHDLAILLDDALNNEMASFIMALPFLIVYMIYRKENLLKAQLSFETEKQENMITKDITGASLCLSALCLYIYGSFAFKTLEYHLISLTLFITGCTVLLMGIRNLRNLILPLSFLLLVIIPYREEAYQAGGQLSTLTSTATYSILRALNYPVTLASMYEAPSITIQTPTGETIPFVIDVPCAGAYSLIGFLVFALFFASISRGPQPKKIGWLITGLILIYATNIARILLTIMIGYAMGIEAAMGLFHLLSGSVLIFLASVFMILIGEKILKIQIFSNKPEDENTCPYCEENKNRNEPFCLFCGRFFNPANIKPARIDLAKIVALSILMVLVINLQAPALALAQSNIVKLDLYGTAGSTETQEFLPVVDGYEPKFVYRDERFEKISKQDASLLFIYSPKNGSYAPIFLSVEIADSYSKLHWWEICLYVVPSEGGTQIVHPIVTKEIQIIENPPLTGRLFTFKYAKSGQTVTILYWYEKLTFKIGGTWANRYVKTSIIAYLDNLARTGEMKSVDEHAKLENRWVSMAETIINHWAPVKTWSAFVVTFAGWGQNLALMSIAASTATVIVLHIVRTRDEEKRARSMHKQLTWHSTFSKEEREIMKVLEAFGEEASTGTDIALSYKKSTGRSIMPEKLMEILGHLQRFDLVKKKIIHRNEKPCLAYEKSILERMGILGETFGKDS